MRRGLPSTDPLRALAQNELGSLLDDVTESWRPSRPPMSEHLRLEIGYAIHRGHEPRTLPSVSDLIFIMGDADETTRRKMLDHYIGHRALHPTEAVPGCGCPSCTGLAWDHPARRRPKRRWPSSDSDDRRQCWRERVEEARRIGILEVARRLGLEPRKAGREWTVSCPFHEDRTPSMGINTEKGVFYCHSCGRGGDGLQLMMDVRRVDFVEAVKLLTADSPRAERIRA